MILGTYPMDSRGISQDIDPQRSKGNIAIFSETPLDMCIIPEMGRNIALWIIMVVQKNEHSDPKKYEYNPKIDVDIMAKCQRYSEILISFSINDCIFIFA